MSPDSCVDVSAGSPHASEWLQTRSESSGMVAEVATEVALEGWTLGLEAEVEPAQTGQQAPPGSPRL